MNPETEKKNKVISGVSTTVIIIIILLIFWFIKFDKTEIELPPELGAVEVTLSSPDGGGSSSDNSSDPKPNVPSMPPPESTEQANDETAVPVKKTSETPRPNPVPELSEDEKLLRDMLNKKKNQSSTKDGNDPDFDGKGPGKGDDKGPGKNNGPGGSGTGGVSSNISGRDLIAYNTIANDCNASGKVIMDVVVQPDGTISKMTPDPGYDDNACLVAKARAILRGAKFDKSSSSQVVTGQITINFKLK